MQHIVIILTCFLIWAPKLAFTQTLMAYIKSDKALIYSDIELQAPIGYLSQNRSIIVSNKAIGPHKAHRIFLKNGRIAYINQNDLFFSDKEITGTMHSTKELEHDVDIERFKGETYNYLTAKIGTAASGAQLKAINSANNVIADKMYFGQFSYERHNGDNNFFFAFGPLLAAYRTEETSFTMITIQADGGYSLVRSKSFALSLLGNVSLIPYANLAVKNFPADNLGSGLGIQYGGRVQLFPDSQFSLFAEYLISSMTIYNLDGIYIASDNPTSYKVDKISGNSLVFGLSYKL